MDSGKNQNNFVDSWKKLDIVADAGTKKYTRNLFEHGKSPLAVALEKARSGITGYVDPEKIDAAERKGVIDGCLDMTYEASQRMYEHAREIVIGKEGNFIERFDEVRDCDLIATAFFCNPEIIKEYGDKWDVLYRASLNVGSKNRRGYSIPEHHEKEESSKEESSFEHFIPSYINADLGKFLGTFSSESSPEEINYHQRFRVLLQKKVERDILPRFMKDENEAFKALDALVLSEDDKNIRGIYQTLADTYKSYGDLEAVDVNSEFIDPQTNEKGVLPSIHQKIALHHIMNERRFGVWDGGGTGKTAIGVLAQPLIERELQKQGKEFRRAVIVCSNPAKKTWRKGLLGNEEERYLSEKQDAIIIDGETKDEKFLEELEKKKWIVLNHEQLTTEIKVNGEKRIFADFLVGMGIDYVIFDESHNLKTLRRRTNKGNPTYSAAARKVALSADYFVPMSATPISNGLKDFAVQYHLLSPETLPNPDDFLELISNSPRVLYSFFHEKSVRRNSEEINDDLDWSEREAEVKLDPIQKKVYNYIVEVRPVGWLQQARKSLVDPRLVNPKILKEAGVLGQVSWRNSSKYKELEKLLTEEDGPVARKEKFIVFSTMFREGVTEPENKKLKKMYEAMGLSQEYENLGLDNTLNKILEDIVGDDIGVIDGTINVEEREKVVDGLKNGLAGIVCTTDTGGESLDFSDANYVYFIDDDYVPSTEQQALWRVLRKGQKREVSVNHLRCVDTLEEVIVDYVDRKRLIAKMAMDGVPPTKEEMIFLDDTDGKILTDLIKVSIGGKSINVYEAKFDNVNDVTTRMRGSIKRNSTRVLDSGENESTYAQKVAQFIGRDKVGFWLNPENVQMYMDVLQNLAVPLVNRARVVDLVKRAKNKEIEFPESVLVEAAGPSLLWDAYQSLQLLIVQEGLQIPEITDRDFSELMMPQGGNQNKIIGNMTGEDSTLKDGKFSMVDNGSISLLRNSDEVYRTILETRRVLQPNGLVELVINGMKFKNTFYSGMENLGFEIINKKNEGFVLGNDAFKRMKKEKGEHFAESVASKLSGTQFLLARKVDNPLAVNPENFWFETFDKNLVEENEKTTEESQGTIQDLGRSSIVVPGNRKKGGRGNSVETKMIKRIDGKFKPEREFVVDKSGVVQSVKDISGEVN